MSLKDEVEELLEETSGKATWRAARLRGIDVKAPNFHQIRHRWREQRNLKGDGAASAEESSMALAEDIDRLLDETDGKATYRDAVGRSIRCTITDFWNQRRLWLAKHGGGGDPNVFRQAEPPKIEEAEEEAEEAEEEEGPIVPPAIEETTGEAIPEVEIPEPVVVKPAKKPDTPTQRRVSAPRTVAVGGRFFLTVPVNFLPEVVTLYNASRNLGLAEGFSSWVNKCIEGFYEAQGITIAMLTEVTKEAGIDGDFELEAVYGEVRPQAGVGEWAGRPAGGDTEGEDEGDALGRAGRTGSQGKSTG